MLKLWNEKIWSKGKMILLFLAGMVIVTGCVHVPQKESVIQHFDKSNSATLTTLATPFSFYRAEPLLAANSRDYVYVGPVEVNRTGQREYFLWLHYCSTIDRNRFAGDHTPSRAFLFIDDKPMELVQAQKIKLDESLYTVPVTGGITVLYRVTRDQLHKLARADQIRLVTEMGPRNTEEYTVWKGAEEGFQLFASYLLDDANIVFAAVQ
ncbi:MAG: hypothetical protein DRR11_17710 [Gammaproteobacteria bacterium]|nr:MAG: hypothetical protein DRR11_17710 [Gammaproteobacteria bacterium]